VEKYKSKYGSDRVTDDPIEAAYIAVHLWAEAVKKAGSFEVEKVKEAAKGLEFKAPEGLVKIEGENQHLWKPVRIGEVQETDLSRKSGVQVKP